MIRKLLITTCILLFACAASAQTPGSVHIMLPNGNSFVQSTATSGTLSSGGITCTWTTTSNSASITFVGNYTTSWIHPSIDLAWFNTSGTLPMAVQITHAEAGTYDFAAPFNTGAWDSSIDFNGLSGNWAWGNVFPACSRFDLDFGLNDQGTAYDLTIEVQWGEGVAAGASTWGGVKTLYR